MATFHKGAVQAAVQAAVQDACKLQFCCEKSILQAFLFVAYAAVFS